MRILFLSRWFPYPADNGSKIRIYNVLRALGEHHEVHLLSFTGNGADGGGEGPAGLREICASVRAVPYRPFQPHSRKALAGFLASQPRSLVDAYNPEMAAAVQSSLRSAAADLIVATEVDMVPYVLDTRGVPAMLDDLEITGYRDAVRHGPWSRRLRAGLTWLKLRSYLRRVLPRFEVCTVVSESERSHVRRIRPDHTGIEVVPNAVDATDYAHATPQLRPGSMIYCGALTFAPNLDAVQHFVADIFPEVRRNAPDATLRVTGGRGDIDVAHLAAAPGVELTGYLPDIRAAVAESWLSVVPVRRGSGTRLKILESMALGTPVVATRKGAQGLDVMDGRDILLADEPEAFARATLGLLASRELRDRLASAGRELVRTRYDWTVLRPQVCDLAVRAASQCA